MKWKKCYGWKENLHYYILLPQYLWGAVVGIMMGDHRRNDMSAKNWIDLHKGLCDMKAGRIYKEVKE